MWLAAEPACPSSLPPANLPQAILPRHGPDARFGQIPARSKRRCYHFDVV